jgi:Fur family ferric uptake transcriptional regulator
LTYKTEKKGAVLNFFKNAGRSAYTVEEICDRILPDGKGKSTVYRIISGLVDNGVLHRIADAKSRHVTYQYMEHGGCSEHFHLKCKDCGKLIHLDDELSHLFEKEILKLKGFALDEGALLYGKCDKCNFAEK